MTKVIDLTHIRGDTFSQRLALSSGAAASFDEVWFTVRAASPGASVIDESTALSSGTLTGGEIEQTGYQEWTVTIDIPDWPVGRLVYDVQIRSSSGQIFTITKGTLRVFNDVTRSV
jgi:hypothetical protein